jgi:hypothetical protein
VVSFSLVNCQSAIIDVTPPPCVFLLFPASFPMPHRRLVQIGQPAKPPAPTEKLPTIAEYFRDLAAKQGEDIRMLKERMAALVESRPKRKRPSRKSVREESWRLHPVVNTKKRAAPKKRKASTKRSSR